MESSDERMKLREEKVTWRKERIRWREERVDLGSLVFKRIAFTEE